jgi:hypothetical protein
MPALPFYGQRTALESAQLVTPIRPDATAGALLNSIGDVATVAEREIANRNRLAAEEAAKLKKQADDDYLETIRARAPLEFQAAQNDAEKVMQSNGFIPGGHPAITKIRSIPEEMTSFAPSAEAKTAGKHYLELLQSNVYQNLQEKSQSTRQVASVDLLKQQVDDTAKALTITPPEQREIAYHAASTQFSTRLDPLYTGPGAVSIDPSARESMRKPVQDALAMAVERQSLMEDPAGFLAARAVVQNSAGATGSPASGGMLRPAVSLGERNNNPGNLRDPGGKQKWQGRSGTDKGGFATFATPEDGLRALGVDLGNKFHRGLNTLDKLIPIYAPKDSGNDPAAYAQRVAVAMGVATTDKLDWNDPDTKVALTKAMVQVENQRDGTPWVDPFADNTYQQTIIEQRGSNAGTTGAPSGKPRATPTQANAPASWHALDLNTQEDLLRQAGALMAAKNTQSKETLAWAMQNHKAMAEEGLLPATKITQADLQGAYGSEEGARIWQGFAGTYEMAPKIHQMLYLPNQALDQFAKTPPVISSEGSASADKQRGETLIAGAQNIIRQRNADPADFVNRNFPNMAISQQAYQKTGDPAKFRDLVHQSLATQKSLGVQAPRVLSNPDKEMIAQTVAKMSPHDAPAYISSLVQEYGPYWSNVVQEMGDKLPPEAKIVAFGPSQSSAELVMQYAGVKVGDIQSKIPVDKKGASGDLMAAKAATNSGLAPFLSTFTAQNTKEGIQWANAFTEVAAKIYSQAILDGAKPEDAAKKAIDHVSGEWNTRENTNSPVVVTLDGPQALFVRIPKKDANGQDVDPDAVARGMRNAIDLAIPQTTDPKRAREFRSSTFWKSSSDGSGLTLWMNDRPVQTPEGGPLNRSWSYLQAKGGSEPAPLLTRFGSALINGLDQKQGSVKTQPAPTPGGGFKPSIDLLGRPFGSLLLPEAK